MLPLQCRARNQRSMNQVRIRVLGCGDAFGSGGRFQSCFMVTSEAGACLLDCGATALVAMRRCAVDPASIDAIFLSHLHGDHFAGLPFLLLEQHFVGRRDRPLVIAGPAGTEQRVMAALEVFFPGSSRPRVGFSTDLQRAESATDGALWPFCHHSLRRHPSLGQRGVRVSSEHWRSTDRLFGRHRMDRCVAGGRARCRSVHHGVLRVRQLTATSFELQCITRTSR